MFSNLSEKLQNTLDKLKKGGKVTEADIKQVTRELKMTFLEADVNYKVVKDLTNRISEQALGEKVLKSLTPAQQIIKIVKDELTQTLGGGQSKITFLPNGITTIMLVGLQGAGKTTTCGKLANKIRKMGKRPLLVACDVYRPAAIKQLQVLGNQLDIPVFSIENSKNPVEIAEKSKEHALKNGNDVVLLDTAGRLHVDEELMNELVEIKRVVKPNEILLTIDSMIGQDAVNVAQTFSETVGIDGIILTKMDGDTRGGAALSVTAVTEKPIKLVGMGEKLSELEDFYPDRVASRILGMGDVLTLIDKAEKAFDQEQAEKMSSKMQSGELDLNDFLASIEQMQGMGSMASILEMIPGISKKQLAGINIDDKELGKIKAIIQSMTEEEKTNPSVIKASRKERIASGSGTNVTAVNRLLKQFEQNKKMMKSMMKNPKKFGRGGLGLPF